MTSGAITLAGALDFETVSSYSIDVAARDVDDQESTTVVTVTVLDVNDVAPVFVETAYHMYIPWVLMRLYNCPDYVGV